MSEPVAEARRSNPNQPRCAGQRKDGTTCRAAALPGSRFCFAHDPARAAQRAAARAKGGRNRAQIVRLRGLVPPRLIAVFDALEAALTEVHDGALDPRAAGAMASLAKAMVSVLQAGELEERVRQLEATRHGGE